MPERIGRAADLERGRARRAVPTLLCAVAAAGLSCQGDCPPATTTTAPLPVHARYVLTRFGTQPLPGTIATPSGVRVRILADTLLFTGPGVGTGSASGGTYTEIAVVGTTASGGGESVVRMETTGTPWTRTTNDVLSLARFGGGAAAATVQASLAELTTGPQLSIGTLDGRFYTFEAR